MGQTQRDRRQEETAGLGGRPVIQATDKQSNIFMLQETGAYVRPIIVTVKCIME